MQAVLRLVPFAHARRTHGDDNAAIMETFRKIAPEFLESVETYTNYRRFGISTLFFIEKQAELCRLEKNLEEVNCYDVGMSMESEVKHAPKASDPVLANNKYDFLAFQSRLDDHIPRVTAKWKTKEDRIPVTNIASLFVYGRAESLLRRILSLHEEQFIHSETSRRSGLPMIVDGQNVDAFGDTGSSTNIVDEAYVHKRGWKMHSQPSIMTLGDKSTLFSLGTVRIETAFADEPEQRKTTVARVVRDFPFDVLLGRPFLRATSTLTKFFHRFKKCVFPRLTPRMSFNFVDTIDELEPDLLSVQLPGGKENAMLDTGANRNIADYQWAVRRGLHLRTGDDFRGWITFPSGERKATVGQVHTMVTLRDGRKVPLTLEVLEDCAVPLVLGEEVIFQYRLFEVDCEINPTYHTVSALDEVLHMDYMPWYHNIVQKAKRKFRKQTVGLSHPDMDESEELERQWQWDRSHGYGKSANVETWMAEYYRREDHQKALYPTVDIKGTLLIRCVPDELVQSVG